MAFTLYYYMEALIGLIIIVLGTLGMCNILRFSELLTPIRSRSPFIDSLLECSMCCGFWSTILVFILIHIHPIIIAPFAGSFICTLFVRKRD